MRTHPMPSLVIHTLRALTGWALVWGLSAVILPGADVYAQLLSITVDTENSSVSYTGYHPVHAWTGTSRLVTGTLLINVDAPARSRITLRAPVQSFDSGNRKRDTKMLELVEAATYPEVTFESSTIVVNDWMQAGMVCAGTWRVQGQLTFHGQTHPVEALITVRISDEQFEAQGTFAVSLKQYRVKRPKLVLVPIRDTIDLRVAIRGLLPLAADARRHPPRPN